MFPYSPQTVFGHGEIGLSLYPGTQDMLNAPQEVIGLQNEHQLPWHSVQELGDFRQEDGNAATDCTKLKRGGRGCRSGGGKPLSLHQTENETAGKNRTASVHLPHSCSFQSY